MQGRCALFGAVRKACYVPRPMPERLFDDPTLPPPGRRSGAGSASVIPYLLKSLATRPQAAENADRAHAGAEQSSPRASAAASPRGGDSAPGRS